IAVVPADASVDAAQVCAQLTAALNTMGKALHISADSTFLATQSSGGRSLCSPSRGRSRARLGRVLADLEERFSWLVYEGGPEANDWTRRCIRQADLVLVAMRFDSSGRGSVPPSAIELYIEEAVSSSFGIDR
ncbi:unnamed protein product, partial [Polarella glacialis]